MSTLATQPTYCSHCSSQHHLGAHFCHRCGQQSNAINVNAVARSTVNPIMVPSVIPVAQPVVNQYVRSADTVAQTYPNMPAGTPMLVLTFNMDKRNNPSSMRFVKLDTTPNVTYTASITSYSVFLQKKRYVIVTINKNTFVGTKATSNSILTCSFYIDKNNTIQDPKTKKCDSSDRTTYLASYGDQQVGNFTAIEIDISMQ